MGAAMRRRWLTGQLALALALGTGWAAAAFDPMAPPVKVAPVAEAGAVVQQDKTLAWVVWRQGSQGRRYSGRRSGERHP